MTDNLLSDPKHLVERLRLAGEEWSDLDAAANLLEETRSTTLARIMTEWADVSVAKAEMLAKADMRYVQHVKDMVEARRMANRAKVRWESGRAFVELARSVESTNRAQMQMAGR